MLNGGYIMVSKTDTNIYEKVNKALTLGKPILWYEDETTCYYIDTISKSGTDIVLTKGGKTITIEADGDITETGDIQNHLYQYYIMINGEIGDNSIYIGFNLSSTINIDIEDMDLDDVKTLIGKNNRYIANIAYGDTSDYALSNEVWSVAVDADNNLRLASKDDDSRIENFTNLVLNKSNSRKTQLF